MDKVYIVISGDYSDYHIERVFQSKEKAEAYVKARNNIPKIETYELSDDNIQKLTTTGKFLRGNIVETPEVWLDFCCEEPDQYITLSPRYEYCFVTKVYLSGEYVCQLSIGKFIPKDQWKEQETIDRFTEVLIDRMAEVKAMLAGGFTTDEINKVWENAIL